jgi:hypothetical protein
LQTKERVSSATLLCLQLLYWLLVYAGKWKMNLRMSAMWNLLETSSGSSRSSTMLHFALTEYIGFWKCSSICWRMELMCTVLLDTKIGMDLPMTLIWRKEILESTSTRLVCWLSTLQQLTFWITLFLQMLSAMALVVLHWQCQLLSWATLGVCCEGFNPGYEQNPWRCKWWASLRPHFPPFW